MQSETGFTTLSAMREITRDVMETVADRPGDSPARRQVRQQTTVTIMMSLLPRDPAETMLAGQCVIFDHLLRDGAHDTLRGQQQDIKLRARPQILATGKMFLAHLARLEQMQTRVTDGQIVQPPVERAASRTDARPVSDIAAPSPAGGVRSPVHPDSDAPDSDEVVSGTVTTAASPDATASAPTDVQNAVRAEAEVGATEAVRPAASTESPTRPHHDHSRQAATPIAQPGVRQTAVGHIAADSRNAAAAPPGNDARPNMLNDQPKAGTQTPSLARPDGTQPERTPSERASSDVPRNQTPGISRQDEVLALLAASLRVSPTTGLAGRTPQGGQSSAPL
jgi:hypothetical protein